MSRFRPHHPPLSRRQGRTLRHALVAGLVAAAIAAAVGCGGSDQAAQSDAVADLRGWVEQARHKSAAKRLSDASVEAEAERLREVVPPAEEELAALSPKEAAKRLEPFEFDLAQHLAGLGRPLTPMQAFFLYTDIQHHLERLSEAARHERLLTGPPTVARTEVPSARAHQAAHRGPNPANTLGIPAPYRARMHFQPGRSTPAHRPCFFVTEPLPDFHTIAAARALADARGCMFK
jgi:hypothetical protein